MTDEAMIERTRRRATKLGLLMYKSRKPISADNLGGYQVSTDRNCIITGSRFELSLADVDEVCRGREEHVVPLQGAQRR